MINYTANDIKQTYVHSDKDLQYNLNEIFKVEGTGSEKVSNNSGSTPMGLEQINDLDDTKGNSDTNELSECVVCFTYPKNNVLLPCKHFCVCGVCAESIRIHNNQCPICRQKITRYI